MQVPRHIHPEISEEGDLREFEVLDRTNIEGAMRTEGDRASGRACDERSCSSVPEHTAEVQRGIYNRISEGEECGKNPSGIAERAANDGDSFLVNRILGEHGGER